MVSASRYMFAAALKQKLKVQHYLNHNRPRAKQSERNEATSTE